MSHAKEFALPTVRDWEPLKVLAGVTAYFQGQPIAGNPAPLASL